MAASVPVPLPDPVEGRFVSGMAENPIPFEELLIPFVRDARRAADLRAGPAHRKVSEAAREQLDRELLEILAAVTVRALYHEFERTRDYRGFVDRMLAGELNRFLDRIPALRRLIETLVDLSIDATAQLVSRLDEDATEFSRRFAAGDPLGEVVAAEPGLSDRHLGGRTVVALTFASGARVVYKPRDLAPERAFFDLVRWVDDRAPDPALGCPGVLERPGYGWMEHVPHLPVADAGEAGRYYRRAGKLLCLFHILGATDCHAGNVIACGERPVPVDLETLLQPRHAASANDLLLVGILPFWKRGLDGKSYDVGALTGSTGRERDFRVWRCRAINTDALDLDIAYETVPTGTNVVYLDGLPVAAGDHVEDVVMGFAETWRFLMAHREELLAADGPLIAFHALSIRTILRSTLVYARYAHEALDPELLVDEGLHAIALERVRSEALGEGQSIEGIELEGVLQAEREAMARMDVPLFHAPSERGYRLAVERIEGLDENGLEEAVGLIRATLGLSKLAALL